VEAHYLREMESRQAHAGKLSLRYWPIGLDV